MPLDNNLTRTFSISSLPALGRTFNKGSEIGARWLQNGVALIRHLSPDAAYNKIKELYPDRKNGKIGQLHQCVNIFY